jgi:hypothetical protein
MAERRLKLQTMNSMLSAARPVMEDKALVFISSGDDFRKPTIIVQQ